MALKDARLVENYLKAIKLKPSLIFHYVTVGKWYLQNEDYENYIKYMDLWVDADDYMKPLFQEEKESSKNVQYYNKRIYPKVI